MLKVVNLPDGKQLALRSSAATAILYKNQFGTDFFADMIRLAKVFDNVQSTGDKKSNDFDLTKMAYDDIANLDMGTLYKVVWAFAKNADSSIGDLETWLGTFDALPLDVTMGAVMELMQSLFTTTKN
ncbi:hypothetical protein [Lacticaseibacillus suibinensis]|uniref:hypothetical protein n=1 Tax=Lacticaseibacillus suibinensis TaxID=2486011 RepID=UPI000F7AADC3|nr:hypothetical protein [Lacticaseibacillus suibinensis]